MKALFIIFSILFTISSDFNQKNDPECYYSINADDFNMLIETKDVILVDVSLYVEFRKERIMNAVLATNRESLKLVLKDVSLNQQILVYCDEGDRSKTAAEIICKELNYKKVYNLSGGIKSWKKKGYLTDKSRITIN